MIPIHDDNPTSRRPYVSWVLIALCVIIFVWQFSSPAHIQQQIVYGLGLIPAVLNGHASLPPEVAYVPSAFTVLTSMFLHGGIMHLAGNMLYLWIFADNVEDAMGHARFIGFYIACGALAAAAQVLQQPDSVIPMVGASGAISGVLGAYLLLYPRANVLVAIPLGFILHTTRVPAALVLVIWFVIQLVSSLSAAPGQPGVAWYAHLGGFVAGCALVPLFKTRRVRLFQGPRRSVW